MPAILVSTNLEFSHITEFIQWSSLRWKWLCQIDARADRITCLLHGRYGHRQPSDVAVIVMYAIHSTDINSWSEYFLEYLSSYGVTVYLNLLTQWVRQCWLMETLCDRYMFCCNWEGNGMGGTKWVKLRDLKFVQIACLDRENNWLASNLRVSEFYQSLCPDLWIKQEWSVFIVSRRGVLN